MKVDNHILKWALFFAMFIFLFTAVIGYFSLVPLVALLYRSAVAFVIAGFLGIVVFSVIGNAVKEELLVLKDREKKQNKKQESVVDQSKE